MHHCTPFDSTVMHHRTQCHRTVVLVWWPICVYTCLTVLKVIRPKRALQIYLMINFNTGILVRWSISVLKRQYDDATLYPQIEYDNAFPYCQMKYDDASIASLYQRFSTFKLVISPLRPVTDCQFVSHWSLRHAYFVFMPRLKNRGVFFGFRWKWFTSYNNSIVYIVSQLLIWHSSAPLSIKDKDDIDFSQKVSFRRLLVWFIHIGYHKQNTRNS